MSTRAAIVMHEYADAAAMAEGLCAVLVSAWREACEMRGGAVFALAGGRTPLAAYERFVAALRAAEVSATSQSDASARHSRANLLSIIPTDDRCVPHDHAASNVAALRGLFTTRPARVETLTAADGNCDASLLGAREMLANHAQTFDLVLLGMGEDAHTASLFPGAPQLGDALDLATPHDVFRIDPDPLPPDAPFARITLGAARLLRTRALHVALAGARKREVFERALAEGDVRAAPIALLRDAPVAVHVHWSPT